MHSPTATTTGIVLTAVEEAAARATMVERDRFFRRFFGGGDYTPTELEKQHVIWTAQINQSMIIEISAIALRTACVVLFLPQRFIFNLGYGDDEAAGVVSLVVVLNMLLELTGEVLTDAIATSAEMEVSAYAHVVCSSFFFSLTPIVACVSLPHASARRPRGPVL